MPDNTRAHADRGGETRSKNSGSASSSLATDSSQDITEIARKLVAHGGGAASLDLAFDIVLHGIVEQARAASGATGAAIALNREGKMVCRATTGENAPDLGVRVEAGSRLTVICLKTGAVQHCRDTESDPRVEPETCRPLGVRSMLLVPLADSEGTFGVLQLFSSLPNAFGDQEIATLWRLADRVTENRRMMVQSPRPAARATDAKVSVPEELKSEKTMDREPEPPNDLFQSASQVSRSGEIWTMVLFLLVIITAVSLGIVVGWSNGRKAATAPGVSPRPNAVSAERTQAPAKSSGQDGGTDSTGAVGPSSALQNEAKPETAPAGGLVVTEKGKVIYRFPEEPHKSLASKPGARELVHRMEPEYPPEARAQHWEGPVILDVEIAADGSVKNATVVSGNPQLASAAVQAVKQWQYQPDPGGTSHARVTLQFNLPVH